MSIIPQQTDTAEELLPPKDRRHVINGYASQTAPRSNRPFRKRRVSTFSIVLLLFLVAVVSVLYVSNVISVNRLAGDVEVLRTTLARIENANEILRSEISRKSSMERITRIASEKMGMAYPRQAPIWFEIDEEPAAGSTE